MGHCKARCGWREGKGVVDMYWLSKLGEVYEHLGVA